MNRFRFLILIIICISSFIITPSVNINSESNLIQKLNEQSQITGLVGNVSLIIIDNNFVYSQEQINPLLSIINSTLNQTYPDLSFSVFLPKNKTTAIEMMNSSFASEDYQYIVNIGNFDLGYRTSTIRQSIPNKLTEYWTNNYTHVKKVGFIDSKSLYSRQNITQVDFDDSQAGFISGIKAADVSINGQIGVILDYPIFNEGSYDLTYNFESYDNNFLSAFLSGVQYASEHLLNRTKELTVKTIAIDRIKLEVDSNNEIERILTELKDIFGADTIFNLVSGIDSQVLDKANQFSLKTGTRGANNSDATFNIIEMLDVALIELIDNWNSSEQITGYTYTLSDENVLFLSDYSFNGHNNLLYPIQENVTNGIIKIPTDLFYHPQATNGFEFVFIFIIFSIVTAFHLRKRKK
ncbi:MAG: hypothetical protein ACXAC7_03040 [Candidatus Hodarchaeales archaeon]|jgi:basic membrane lipoprotein Med (substrate-binding protein (PBP1-ABC) superfamily)